MQWFVYMLLCADGTLYTGITTNIERRVNEHNHSKLGAKYTRARQPVELVYTVETHTRSEALKKEAELRRLKRAQKILLVKKPITR